jgi:hypothetical protein
MRAGKAAPGSIGVLLRKGVWSMWRFGDRADQPIDLSNAVRFA